MWDFIINLIYRQSCRKYLVAARKQTGERRYDRLSEILENEAKEQR